MIPFSYAGEWYSFNESFQSFVGTTSLNVCGEQFDGSETSVPAYNVIGDIGTWYYGHINGTFDDCNAGQNLSIGDFGFNDNKQIKLDINPSWEGTFLLHTFNDDMVFRDGITNLSITHNASNNEDSEVMAIVFKDSNNRCKLIIDTHAGLTGQVFTSLCQADSTYNCTGLTEIYFERNTNEIAFNTAACNVTNDFTFNRIFYGVEPESGSDADIILDDFIIRNLWNGSNQKPSVNVTITQDCFNETTGKADIRYRVDAYDPDGDQIYFLRNEIFGRYKNYTQDFQYFSTSLFANVLPDYSYLDKVYRSSDTCIYNSEQDEFLYFYNASKRDLVAFKTYYVEWFSLLSKTRYGVLLNNDCDGGIDKKFYYDMGGDADRSSMYLEFRDLDDDDTFNISVIDYRRENKILQFHYNVSDNNITAYKIDSNKRINVGSVGVGPILNKVAVIGLANINIDLGTMTHRLYYSKLEFPEIRGSFISKSTGLLLNDSLMKYIEVGVDNGDIILADMLWANDEIEYNWSTDAGTNLTGSLKGTQVFTVRYTDGYWWDNNTYWEVTSVLDIVDCSMKITGITGCDLNIPILCHIKKVVGNRIENYLRNQGTYYEDGKDLMWVIFMFLFITSVISYSILLRTITFVIPLITSSLACFFLSWLVNYNGLTITFLSIAALGLAVPLAAMFLGSRT